MRPTEAYASLLRLERPVLSTSEAATRLDVTVPAASKLLAGLERAGLVRRLRRGLWLVDPALEPFALSPYLTAPFPAYVSLWSALAHHGMIEQIPRRTYVASLARSQRITTALGEFSIHHLAPELFDGYSQLPGLGFVAIPEKALFDTVYVRAPAGGGQRLPEIELPAEFDERRLETWISRIRSQRLRTLVTIRLHRIRGVLT